MAVIELARVDGSMSTFLMVHNSLTMLTIGLLGSEAQKAELLPPMARLDWVGELLDMASCPVAGLAVNAAMSIRRHRCTVRKGLLCAVWCDISCVCSSSACGVMKRCPPHCRRLGSDRAQQRIRRLSPDNHSHKGAYGVCGGGRSRSLFPCAVQGYCCSVCAKGPAVHWLVVKRT